MNNERFWILFTMLVFSFIGLSVFGIHAYIIVLLLIGAFAFEFYQGKEKLQRKSDKENKELLNEIKTTTKDAHLKHKQLLTMISNIPSPLVLLDVEGKVVLYNSYFNLLRNGKEEKELDYLNNDFHKEADDFLKDAFILEKNITRVINVDNRTFQAISVPVTTGGKFSGCVILFQDYTQAKERERMQKQFIADASHELKTPISVIKGMIEILNREGFEDDKIKNEFLIQIEKETKRLEFIVKDLLESSRLSVENLVLKRELMDFTKIIDATIDSFEMMANRKKITLKKQYKSHDRIFVDKDMATTLINNLISNAIKYSDSGEILISTRNEKEEYIVSIKDEGYGLSKEDQNKIFDRFYRVDKARSRDGGGSGLGLSIVNEIVEAHGAKIKLESELGKGSTFTIYFKY